jgi:hypothetical protein
VGEKSPNPVTLLVHRVGMAILALVVKKKHAESLRPQHPAFFLLNALCFLGLGG